MRYCGSSMEQMNMWEATIHLEETENFVNSTNQINKEALTEETSMQIGRKVVT